MTKTHKNFTLPDAKIEHWELRTENWGLSRGCLSAGCASC